MSSAPDTSAQPPVDVFGYSDYRKALSALFQQRKSIDPAFSYRAIARALRLRSPGTFGNIVSGRNRVSPARMHALCELFGLGEREEAYLQALVAYSFARTYDDRETAFRDAREMALAEVEDLPHDAHDIYGAWYHTAIWALLAHYPFDGDYGRLGSALTPAITADQARTSVDLLQRRGMLSRRGGYLRPRRKLVTTGKTGSGAVRSYQLDTIDLAVASVDRFGPDKRELSTVTVSLSEQSYRDTVGDLADCRRRILSRAARDKHCDRVYQLNMQAFPLALPPEDPQ